MEYERLEPFGDRRGDWQAASICSMIANMELIRHGSKKRFQPGDFLLEFSDTPKQLKEGEPPAAQPPNWQGMKFIAQQMTALANAEAKRDAKKRKR